MTTIYLTDGLRRVRTKRKGVAIALEECGWRRCGRREYQALVRRQEHMDKSVGKGERAS